MYKKKYKTKKAKRNYSGGSGGGTMQKTRNSNNPFEPTIITLRGNFVEVTTLMGKVHKLKKCFETTGANFHSFSTTGWKFYMQAIDGRNKQYNYRAKAKRKPAKSKGLFGLGFLGL